MTTNTKTITQVYGNATLEATTQERRKPTYDEVVMSILGCVKRNVVDTDDDGNKSINWERLEYAIANQPNYKEGMTGVIQITLPYHDHGKHVDCVMIVNVQEKDITILRGWSEFRDKHSVDHARETLLHYNVPEGEELVVDNLPDKLKLLYDAIEMIYSPELFMGSRAQQKLMLFSIGANNKYLTKQDWKDMAREDTLREKYPKAFKNFNPNQTYTELQGSNRILFALDRIHNVRHLKGTPTGISRISELVKNGDIIWEHYTPYAYGLKVISEDVEHEVDFKTGEFTIGYSVGRDDDVWHYTQDLRDVGIIRVAKGKKVNKAVSHKTFIRVSGTLPLDHLPDDTKTVNYAMVACAMNLIGLPELREESGLLDTPLYQGRTGMRELIANSIRELARPDNNYISAQVVDAVNDAYKTLISDRVSKNNEGKLGDNYIPMNLVGLANTHINHLQNLSDMYGVRGGDGFSSRYCRALKDTLCETWKEKLPKDLDEIKALRGSSWNRIVDEKSGVPERLTSSLSYTVRNVVQYGNIDFPIQETLMKKCYESNNYYVTVADVEREVEEILKHNDLSDEDIKTCKDYGLYVTNMLVDDPLLDSTRNSKVKVKAITSKLFNGNKQVYKQYLELLKDSESSDFNSLGVTLLGGSIFPDNPTKLDGVYLSDKLSYTIAQLSATDVPVIVNNVMATQEQNSYGTLSLSSLSSLIKSMVLYGLTPTQCEKVLEYTLEDAIQRQRILPRESVQTYRDYLNAVSTLVNEGVRVRENLDLTPQSIKLAHDIATFEVSIIQEELDQRKWDECYAMLDDMPLFHKPLTYKSKKYSLYVPKGKDDLVTEGHGLHHCVGSYLTRIVENNCIILMLRNEDNKEKPFITVEFNKRGSESAGYNYTLGQVRGTYNKSYREDEVIVKYLKERVAMVNDYEGYVKRLEALAKAKKEVQAKKKAEKEAVTNN